MMLSKSERDKLGTLTISLKGKADIDEMRFNKFHEALQSVKRRVLEGEE